VRLPRPHPVFQVPLRACNTTTSRGVKSTLTTGQIPPPRFFKACGSMRLRQRPFPAVFPKKTMWTILWTTACTHGGTWRDRDGLAAVSSARNSGKTPGLMLARCRPRSPVASHPPSGANKDSFRKDSRQCGSVRTASCHSLNEPTRRS